jgi:hypothetical protein
MYTPQAAAQVMVGGAVGHPDANAGICAGRGWVTAPSTATASPWM